jgi:hypothetical protein
MGYGLEGRGLISRGALFPTVLIPALRPTRPPIKWVPRPISPRIKRPLDEADHSPVFSAEVKNGEQVVEENIWTKEG